MQRPPVVINRTLLSVERFGTDHWVERPQFTGLIQLYLQDLAPPLAPGNRGNSHTSHLTEKAISGAPARRAPIAVSILPPSPGFPPP